MTAPTDPDDVDAILGKRPGESLTAAAQRVVRERDTARAFGTRMFRHAQALARVARLLNGVRSTFLSTEQIRARYGQTRRIFERL